MKIILMIVGLMFTTVNVADAAQRYYGYTNPREAKPIPKEHSR